MRTRVCAVDFMPLAVYPLVRRCLLASIPASCPDIVKAREAVEFSRCGAYCSSDSDEIIVIPEIVHETNVSLDSSYTFVYDFGLPHTVAPYLRPYQEVFYSYGNARKYLSDRADI